VTTVFHKAMSPCTKDINVPGALSHFAYTLTWKEASCYKHW
jgi:hypothetical protein